MSFSSARSGAARIHNDRPPCYSGERGWLAWNAFTMYPSALQALALVIHHHCSDDALEPRGDRGCAAKLVARKSDTHSRAVKAVHVDSLALQRGGQTPAEWGANVYGMSTIL